jgi:hypothetical protein
MKLAAPELSELDESWSDEPERIADRRPSLPGMPPPPVIVQMPLPRPALPALPVIMPESTLTLPAAPVLRKPRDHHDATWIVRPRRDAVMPVRRRPWWIAGIAGALVVLGALGIAWLPAVHVAPVPPLTARAPAASAPPTTPQLKPAHPAIAHPTKRIATPIKRGATKKPAAKAKPPTRPSAKTAATPVAKPPATPARKRVGKPLRDPPAGTAPPV